MSYTEYWGLNESAFDEVCDTRFFFESDDHREALDRLLYIANDKNMNMGLLTGEVGSGKTITKKVFTNSLPSQDFEVISFDNSSFPFVDILYDINRRMTFKDPRIEIISGAEEPVRNDKYQLMSIFKQKLESLAYEDKRHLVVIFDEAQQIEDQVLDELKNLTNMSSDLENFMTVFLVGQPELREKVRNMKQINQRVYLRFHLNNLDFNNTVNYIQHRFRVAGKQSGTIFDNNAFELIFRRTEGIPREINRLCKLALTFGFAHELELLTKSDIEVIIEDMDRHS